MEQQTDRLVVVDTETFGLDFQHDYILELGFTIVDTEFNIIDTWDTVVWDTPSYDYRLTRLTREADQGAKGAQYVRNLHRQSGLFTECREEGASITQATEEAYSFLAGHGIEGGDPMVGSSVQFDRQMLFAQMLPIHNRFHYRNIVISTVKELCRRYNPRVYSKLYETTKKKELHRVIPDMEDTINELKFYTDNFLWTA